MGAPIPKMVPVDNSSAEALLSSLEGMAAAERRKHASIFNYWLSIRGDRQFPPIRDLDPLEISDAGPWSVLLEMIGPGENAVIRHLGQAIKLGVDAESIARAPVPSLLSCIHAKLPDIASSMQAMAFEDSFETDGGITRCWVTLLPFSANGAWIDYVYGFVSLDGGESAQGASAAPSVDEDLDAFQVPLRPLDEEAQSVGAETAPADPVIDGEDPVEAEPQPDAEFERAAEIDEFQPADQPFEPEPETEAELEMLPESEVAAELVTTEVELEPLVAIEPEIEPEPEPEPEPDPVLESEPEPEALVAVEPELAVEPESEAAVDAEPEAAEAEPEPEPVPEPEAGPESDELILEDGLPPAKAGFSAKFLESLAHVGGFYGRVVQAPEPTVEEIEVDTVPEPVCEVEGTLQSKLIEVQAMAEEARQALLRSELALCAGLSAAYDFALDAEDAPEEYLRLVEGQGLKIQLRSPMKPVVKLAFSDTCDETTIGQLEAVLAWALKQDLPRGSLAERIAAEGGIGAILEGLGKAA